MCGIAGIVDLRGRREVDRSALVRMAAALVHRGPDEDGFWYQTGVGLASRRLSIVGLTDGRQPIFNEDRTVAVVFNGELFDYPERRTELAARGHLLRTSCDTEIVAHLWEDHGERMFEHLRGQFALALFDTRRRTLVLARDRVGICPLYWSRQDDWLFFGSEMKALLASGGVPAQLDPLGIDHAFTFFAQPARRTTFAKIEPLLPGQYLKIELPAGGRPALPCHCEYWDLDFPPQGEEDDPPDSETLVEEFRATFRRAVELRLRADVPVVSYLSSGIDSSAVLAMTARLCGAPVPSFTIRLASPQLDESSIAEAGAAALGGRPTVVDCDAATLAGVYPDVVRAADAPVVDAAVSGLFCLAREVHRQGFKVALTGEGADEALAGYPWFKVHRLLGLADIGPLRPGRWLRSFMARCLSPLAGPRNYRRITEQIGGPYAQGDFYALFSSLRRRFYNPQMWECLAGRTAFDDLEFDRQRIARWHPLNQSLYFGYKTMLPGLLLSQRGDRIAMANSVETRYPFLDEDVIALCARLHPRWKLRGLTGDKHLLREAARGLLPDEVARRRKRMFRAPYGETFFVRPPRYVEQLLSAESLRRTGWFDARQVADDFARCRTGPSRRPWRILVEMGLMAVLACQLWQHLYLGGGLCELPEHPGHRA